jgi:hypothetical protein
MTRLSTVGTSEVVLHLLAACQIATGREPDPHELWKKIREFINTREPDGYRFSSYIISNHSSRRPAGQYLADLTELVEAGLAVPTSDGKLRVTKAGQAMASVKAIPASLSKLEAAVLGKS